jgi:hypothetical protein
MLFVGCSRHSSDSLAVRLEPRRFSAPDHPLPERGKCPVHADRVPGRCVLWDAEGDAGYDLVIDPSRPQLDRLVELFGASGLYVSSEAAVEAFERGGQFNAIDAQTGWRADLIVRKEREFRGEFERRQPAELFGLELALATVEDLIIAKLEWSELGVSELQRRDFLQLLDATGSSLDKAYLERWVRSLGLDGAWAKVTQGRR